MIEFMTLLFLTVVFCAFSAKQSRVSAKCANHFRKAQFAADRFLAHMRELEEREPGRSQTRERK